MKNIFFVDLVPVDGIGQEVETNSPELATVAYNSMLEQARSGDRVVLRMDGRKIHETTVFMSFADLSHYLRSD